MRRIVRSLVLVVVACAVVVGLRPDGRHPARRARGAPAPDVWAPPHAPSIPPRLLARSGSRGVEAGLELLDEPSPEIRAGAAAYLGMRGAAEAVPKLIRLLRDPDAGVRCSAAAALGTIGDPRALPFLERALADSDLEVAETAMNAARRIHTLGER